MADEYRILDLGGGPDLGINSGNKQEISFNLTPRGVTLARKNPRAQVIILDPEIPSHLAQTYKSELPNLLFVEGEVRKSVLEGLPFPNNSVDLVEINFLFAPINYDQWKDFPSPLDWMKQGLTTIEQTPLYKRALVESARVLKNGGKLVVTERQGRINAIKRILSKSGTLQMDSDFLRDNNLTFISSGEIDTSGRSPQAVASTKTRDTFLQNKLIDKAEGYRVFELTFCKNNQKL